jgi:hypothetical protein
MVSLQVCPVGSVARALCIHHSANTIRLGRNREDPEFVNADRTYLDVERAFEPLPLGASKVLVLALRYGGS